MSAEENTLLERFARKLGEESYRRYHSCYSKVMKVLQEKLHVAEGIKAGSLAMGFKIKEHGDLDVIFTYIEPSKNAFTIRSELRDSLQNALRNEAVVRLIDPQTSRSVEVFFENEVKIDVVYKDRGSFEKEKRLIDHYNNLPEEIINTIRLVKYAYENFSNNNLNKRNIHQIAAISTGNLLAAKVKYTINRCGAGDKTNQIYNFLISEARKI